MRHGYFHDGNREYIVEHADVPVLWMNYLGIRGLCAVISLSAVVDRPLPYGCITRVAAGQIVDVVEETGASPQVRQQGPGHQYP